MFKWVLDNLELIGLGLGVASAIVLGFSVAPLLRSLRFVTQCLAVSIETILEHRDVVQFTGIDENLKRASRKANRRALMGCVLLAASFACQGAALYFRPIAVSPYPTSPQTP